MKSMGGGGGGDPSSPGAAAAAAAAQQAAFSMQTMQLEWLARTGMLYHRFPELAGKCCHVV